MVEWKKLGEVCTKITDGSHNPPIGVDYSLNRMISSQNVYNGHIDFSSVRYLSDADFEKENKRTNAKKGDVVLTIVGTIGRCCVLDGNEGNIAFQRSVALLKPSNAIKSSFLMHYLINNNKHLNSQSNGGAQKGIYLKQLERILIPIPPLSEQQRIVEQLDTFTASIDNLKEQIAQRRKQYEYYRDELLDLEGKEGVEMKTLENLGDYFGGLTGKTKEDFVDGNAKFITYMNVFANPSLDITTTGVVRINEGEKQNKIKKGDILFTGSSETPEEAGMSCVVTDELNEDYYMNSFCFGLRLDHQEQYNLGYLKHILRSTNIRKLISKSASGVTRFNISKARFGKIQIPIPSLSEQQRIVSILDTFEASIQNLEAQLEQRQKQYEYYRNKLLTFE